MLWCTWNVLFCYVFLQITKRRKTRKITAMSVNESSFPTVSPKLHDISLIRRSRRILWLLLPNSNIWEQCRTGSPAVTPSECAGCHLQDIGNMKEKGLCNKRSIYRAESTAGDQFKTSTIWLFHFPRLPDSSHHYGERRLFMAPSS